MKNDSMRFSLFFPFFLNYYVVKILNHLIDYIRYKYVWIVKDLYYFELLIKNSEKICYFYNSLKKLNIKKSFVNKNNMVCF